MGCRTETQCGPRPVSCHHLLSKVSFGIYVSIPYLAWKAYNSQSINMNDLCYLLWSSQNFGVANDELVKNSLRTELEAIQLILLCSISRYELVLHLIGPGSGLALSFGYPVNESLTRKILVFATPRHCPGMLLVEYYVNARGYNFGNVATLLFQRGLASWSFREARSMDYYLGSLVWV